MTVTAIVAMGKNRAIGKNNQLLWHLPDDLKRFKELTLGHTVIMGRNTHESIGRPLPSRTNIVLSRDPAFVAKDCITVHSPEEALKAVPEGAEVFIIGGETMYVRFMPITRRIYLTRVNTSPEGDAFFPELNMDEWQETENIPHPADERHAVPFSFVTLDRVR